MDWGAQGREAFVIESGATNRTARSRSSSWLRPTKPPTAGSCLINSASPMQNASCMLLTSSASSTTSMLSLTAQMPFAAQRTHAWCRTSKVLVVWSSLFPFATNTYEIMIRRHPNEARLQPHDEPLRARRPFQRDRIDLLFSPENNGWQSSSTSSLLHHTPRIPRIYKECSGDFFFFF